MLEAALSLERSDDLSVHRQDAHVYMKRRQVLLYLMGFFERGTKHIDVSKL